VGGKLNSLLSLLCLFGQIWSQTSSVSFWTSVETTRFASEVTSFQLVHSTSPRFALFWTTNANGHGKLYPCVSDCVSSRDVGIED
jgi:hypothetical protein